MSNVQEKRTSGIQRQHLHVLTFMLLIISTVALLWWTIEIRQSRSNSFVTAPDTVPEEQVLENVLQAHQSAPVLLRINAINLAASFEGAMGLFEDGTVEVPIGYHTLGWYKYGPTPGELGPATILGHVDSKDGPGVFYSLGQVSEGDPVEIEREDGSIVTYEVTGLERVVQDEFPTERVYGNIPYAGLRLITCSGVYDEGKMRYSHNLIVYGKLVSVEYPDGKKVE